MNFRLPEATIELAEASIRRISVVEAPAKNIISSASLDVCIFRLLNLGAIVLSPPSPPTCITPLLVFPNSRYPLPLAFNAALLDTKILGTVTKKLDYLVIGNSKPTKKKIQTAKDLKINLLTEDKWYELLDR